MNVPDSFWEMSEKEPDECPLHHLARKREKDYPMDTVKQITSFFTIDRQDSEVESTLSPTAELITFALLVSGILIKWETVKGDGEITRSLILGLLMLIIAMTDFWVPKRKMIHLRHIRSIFKTLGITLFGYSLYLYVSKQATNNSI